MSNWLRGALAWWVLAVGVSPIFVTISGLNLTLLNAPGAGGPLRRDETAISLLAIFVAALGLRLVPTFSRTLLAGNRLLLGALTVITYVLLLGSFGALQTADYYPLLYAVQYAFPVAAIMIGYLVHRTHNIPLVRVLTTFVILQLALPAIFFWYYFFQQGNMVRDAYLATDQSIHHVHSYSPAAVLMACVLLLGWNRGRRLATILFPAVCILLVFYATWSRSSVLVGAFSMATYGILLGMLLSSRQCGRSRSQMGACIVLVLAGVIVPQLGMVGLRSDLPGTISTGSAKVTKAGAQGDIASAGAADRAASPQTGAVESLQAEPNGENLMNSLDLSRSRRILYMREGLGRWWESPLFGIMFVPDAGENSRGEIGEHKIVFRSHSQYIDILLKTGLVGLLFMAAFYLRCIIWPLARITFAAGETHHVMTYGVMLAVLVGTAAGANFYLYFTMWTTGVPLGLIVGYIVADAERVETGPQERA